MQRKTKIFCIIGGIYFILDYIFNQLSEFIKSFNVAEIFSTGMDGFVAIFNILCLALLFICILKKDSPVFVSKFINKFPKTSVFIFYIGYVGCILFIFDFIILAPTEFIDFSETVIKYIEFIVTYTNILGIFIALILALCKVLKQ